jgi:hypothetical protein
MSLETNEVEMDRFCWSQIMRLNMQSEVKGLKVFTPIIQAPANGRLSRRRIQTELVKCGQPSWVRGITEAT